MRRLQTEERGSFNRRSSGLPTCLKGRNIRSKPVPGMTFASGLKCGAVSWATTANPFAVIVFMKDFHY
jgi:hypothetical protein